MFRYLSGYLVFIYLILSTWIPCKNHYCNIIINRKMIFLLVFFVGPSRLLKITSLWFYWDLPDSKVSAMNKKGDFLLAIGSPFRVMSPMHFFNRYYNYYCVELQKKLFFLYYCIWSMLESKVKASCFCCLVVH